MCLSILCATRLYVSLYEKIITKHIHRRIVTAAFLHRVQIFLLTYTVKIHTNYLGHQGNCTPTVTVNC